MTIGHWTAAVVVASLLAGCNPGRKDADTSAGAGGTTGAATATDTTMTGGQGGMADTSMGGMHDTSKHDTSKKAGAADTSRP
jgi:hypothetical protein